MTVRIATRGSELALWQAHHVRDALRARDPSLEVELLTIKTQGDKILDTPLAKIGGKGLFVKEIQEALLRGDADLAVHSMKDVPIEQTPGLHMAAISTREDPVDALCSRSGAGLDALPAGARIGTSSVRRVAQIAARRGDLVIQSLRGNVGTRLRKLDEGQFDAIVLAAAGLKRLGLADRITERLAPPAFLPAIGQGALGIETRADDPATTELVRAALDDPDDGRRVRAERAFLTRLHGGCQTPIAAHATLAGDELELDGLVASLDGATILRGRGAARLLELAEQT